MSVDRPGEPDFTEKWVVHRRDVPQLTVYSWSRGGVMHSAWPGDGKRVPVDGTEIKLRIVAFPSGSVREIYLDKEARTHPHLSDEAVLFYQIDGRRVQMVNERSHELNPGDACLQPTGVQHSTFQLIAGLFVEFALPASLLPNPEATWITASEAGAPVVPPWFSETGNRGGCRVRTFDLPGYPLHEVHLTRGTVVARRAQAREQMFYVVKGRMAVTLVDIRDTVLTGDCLRSPVGSEFAFTALEDTVYIQTAVPPLTCPG